MPSIASRMNVDVTDLPEINPPSVPYSNNVMAEGNPAMLSVSSTSPNLMTVSGGNSVPMRGILPIEQMSDSDLYRFYPNTAYFNRRWSSVYYQLYNGS